MSIGQKIRELRVSKLMTQSELAGTQITRNMLSCIENDSAQPSLATVRYIAARLNVPAGFLLAEEGDEIVYRKMNSFSNIKAAYVMGDFWGCRSLCNSSCPEPDDEIYLLLADCDAEIAEAELWAGRLRSCCRFWDEALVYADKTMYRTAHIEARAKVVFRYLQRLSPTLYSDVFDEDRDLSLHATSDFARYTEALEALDEGVTAKAEAYLAQATQDSFFAQHLRAECMCLAGDYVGARALLSGLLDREEPLNKVNLYEVLCVLEVCCRETEDFRAAYKYANEKMLLLEQLLKEI